MTLTWSYEGEEGEPALWLPLGRPLIDKLLTGKHDKNSFPFVNMQETLLNRMAGNKEVRSDVLSNSFGT
jgi:hypothetical protein